MKTCVIGSSHIQGPTWRLQPEPIGPSKVPLCLPPAPPRSWLALFQLGTRGPTQASTSLSCQDLNKTFKVSPNGTESKADLWLGS